MLKLFSKSYLSTLLAVVSLSAMNSSLMASECCEPDCSRMYIGAFGGGIYSDSSKASQMGTAFFTEAVGGPLAVFARGHIKKTSTGFGGIQIGYEGSKCSLSSCSNWTIASAVELEGYWYSHKQKGHFINDTDPLRLPEHDFVNSFKSDAGVYLANVVLSLNNSCCGSLSPYIGAGIGATRISLKDASSIQVSPPEVGVNHFNSKRNDSTWAFAAQAKAGLRYNVFGSFHIFGEYRYLFVDSSNYIFGSTVYPAHAPTSPWNFKVEDTQYNAFVFGIQYDL